MKLESFNFNRIARVIFVTSAAGLGLGVSTDRLLAATSYEPYSFTHFAGSLGGPGYTDGTNSAARFSSVSGGAAGSVKHNVISSDQTGIRHYFSRPPVLVNGQNRVANPISGAQQFYRLTE